MPDWIVHICIAYLVCRILYFKYPLFGPQNTILAMIGSLLPDIFKLQIIFSQFGIDLIDFLPFFHIPVASFIVAGIISQFLKIKELLFLSSYRGNISFCHGFITHQC